MKEQELRECSTCSICSKKIGKSGLPMFWRVKIERFGLDLNACQRQQGLAMQLGGHGALAQVMGPNEDLAVPVMDEVTVIACEVCATTRDLPVAVLAYWGGGL